MKTGPSDKRIFLLNMVGRGTLVSVGKEYMSLKSNRD
jgi:hypothetical protein